MRKKIIYSFILFTVFLLNFQSVSSQEYNNENMQEFKKKLVFHEDFSSNKNKWPVYTSPQKFAKIKNGRYYLKATNEDFQVRPKLVNKPLPDNFELKISYLFKNGAENLFRIFMRFPVQSHLNPQKLRLIKMRLRSAFKPHEINELMIRKIGVRYAIFLNDKLIRTAYTEKTPGKVFRINVVQGTEMFIDDIKISEIIYEPNNVKNTKPKIFLYTPKSERGFVKISNKEINSPETSGIMVSGKVEPYQPNVQLSLNNGNIRLLSSGTFQTMYSLQKGENILVFELKQNGNLIDKKEININYQPESENQNITDKQDNANEKRLALVIGNAAYEFGGKLANPENDARAIAEALRKTGFEVMQYTNLSQKDIKKAIDEFGEKLQSYDVGLFFYAGHGVQVKGSNYLVPIDANVNSESDVEYDCVNAERVLARMEDAGSSVNIVILDACRNNPFERSWTRSTQGKGLAFMNAPSGSLIAYATSPGTTASDGSGNNGLYTSAILKHLATPGISILEMFQRVRATVMEESGDRQVPWESTSLRGNFYFVK